MNINNDESDIWTSESFDDRITRAMIALYETKIDPLLTDHPMYGITPSTLAIMRKIGLMIPALDREVWLPEDGENYIIPEDVPTIPDAGIFSFGQDNAENIPEHDRIVSYNRIMGYRKVNNIPRCVKRLGVGPVYETLTLHPENNAPLIGRRDYVTFSPATRRVIPCVYTGSGQNAARATLKRLGDRGFKSELIFGCCVQFADDFRHQWRITALTSDTKITVGAYAENVKSLLFARTLPMTPTGRKRPILHLVSAHKRRMQSGIDIDIKQFLRGTREIVMDGTKFKVDAPERLIQQMLEA